MSDWRVDIINADCLTAFRQMPSESVHCVVTSPPYWGLRDYKVDGQIGIESTPEAYVAKMVEIFAEVWRVLRDDGTLWLNLGSSYAGGIPGSGGSGITSSKQVTNRGAYFRDELATQSFGNFKAKDLIPIPWMVAMALQSQGWYLRSDIIWHKPNPMPESVRDRPTKSHEYIFLLTKAERYWYDAEAIKEESVDIESYEGRRPRNAGQMDSVDSKNYKFHGSVDDNGHLKYGQTYMTRNKRSVWTVATQGYSGAHFATFPPKLIEPCILAGCPGRCCPICGRGYERVVERTPMVIDRSERTHELGRTRSSGTMVAPPQTHTLGFQPACNCGAADGVAGTVLDPFAGSGTTGEVALKLNRKAILIELNTDYCGLIRERIKSLQQVMQL